MISLRACQNTKKDALTAFRWRNDAETVAASYCPEPRSWDAFFMEYTECYFCCELLTPVFVLFQKQPAGFIRFEPVSLEEFPEKRVAEIMINIAPGFRHRGVGTRAVELIKKIMKERAIDGLTADIRKENKVSQRLFEKTNFVFLSERTETVPKIQKNCHILRYYCAL